MIDRRSFLGYLVAAVATLLQFTLGSRKQANESYRPNGDGELAYFVYAKPELIASEFGEQNECIRTWKYVFPPGVRIEYGPPLCLPGYVRIADETFPMESHLDADGFSLIRTLVMRTVDRPHIHPWVA